MAEEYQYSKVRKQFGRPPAFDDLSDGIKLVGTVYPDSSKAENFVLRNPNKLVVDNIPQMSYHTVSNRYNSHLNLGQHRARCNSKPWYEARDWWLAQRVRSYRTSRNC